MFGFLQLEYSDRLCPLFESSLDECPPIIKFHRVEKNPYPLSQLHLHNIYYNLRGTLFYSGNHLSQPGPAPGAKVESIDLSESSVLHYSTLWTTVTHSSHHRLMRLQLDSDKIVEIKPHPSQWVHSRSSGNNEK